MGLQKVYENMVKEEKKQEEKKNMTLIEQLMERIDALEATVQELKEGK